MNVNAIAQSGMQVAQRRLDSAANNVANAQTPGYQREQVSARAQPQGGVTATVDKVPASGADLAQDMLDQMSAVQSYKANAQVVKAADRMVGALLDAKA